MERHEAAEAYRAALRQGRRYVAERHGRQESGLLTVLEPMLTETCGEIPLGLYDIPLKKVRGTYSAGRAGALSGDFMPLLPEQSEFSSKWQSLYVSALGRGITEAIRVYEFIGYYYVVEGHKRVSVARCMSSYSLLAEVTRLLPPPEGETPERAVFTEILDGDRKKIIRHMWFSMPGRITELRKAAGGDEEKLDEAFTGFRAAYHRQGFDQTLPEITTGDAFWQYAKIYPLTEHDPKNLTRCRPQWELLAKPEPVQTVSDPSGAAFRRAFLRGVTPNIAFLYRGTVETRFSAAAHDVGRFALERAFPGMPISVTDGLGSDAYEPPDLGKANVIFATDPSLSGLALRIALESRGALVMLYHDGPVGLTGTYYAGTEGAAFLMGVVAGVLSRSACIGWVRFPRNLIGRGHDLQAFAQGARTVRPMSRVYMSGEREEHAALLRRWAERGVDTVFLPLSAFERRPAVKSFPGVYAHLFALSREGTAAETLAAAAWHWDAFYLKFIRGLIEGGSPPEQPHFRLGLDSGLLNIHLIGRAMSAANCLEVFRGALIGGTVEAVDENAPAEVYEW